MIVDYSDSLPDNRKSLADIRFWFRDELPRSDGQALRKGGALAIPLVRYQQCSLKSRRRIDPFLQQQIVFRLAFMFLRSIQLIGLAIVALPHVMMQLSVRATDALVFNTTPPTNDLSGSFEAQVLFAQSQIFPARPRPGDDQPHLTGKRKTLLIVRPLRPHGTNPLSVTIRDARGNRLGTLDLNPPDQIPKTAYSIDDAPDEPLDFPPSSPADVAISNANELKKLDDEKANHLLDILNRHAAVNIDMADGRWVRNVYLPSANSLDGKIVRLQSQAGYEANIFYSGRRATLSRGKTLQFKCVKNQWLQSSDLENNGITYAADAWTGVMPAEWIVPGITLEFQQGNRLGKLVDLHVGAPTQLLIHTIDIGMLTTPRDQFAFANDPEAHREYFQTVPTSRLIVCQYAPLHLKEVMLPDGTLLTDADPGNGGWHEGTMRQHIGKELISHGIDNANYGINSLAGEGEGGHPYIVAQLAAHNNRGVYANGVQVHGGSGGNGIVTLDNSLGNEFSHEVGHNYGLGHYVGGFNGSVHRPADQNNSTWGWDADKNRFIPNFAMKRSGRDTCVEGQCQTPFDGRSYGLDAMAGGAPLSGMNRFTLYTPHIATIIQRFLESKAVFDPRSETGFSKWSPKTARMEPYQHRISTGREATAPINELSEQSLTTLLAEYDRVRVAMSDGNWKPEIPLPMASAGNRGRSVIIDHSAAYKTVLRLNGKGVTVSRGFKKTYVSNGRRWNESDDEIGLIERKPKHFGVPVVTLVGYYDPQGQLPSYIYPALHGVCGFCYADDSSTLTETDCYLRVETNEGELRFRLANVRLSQDGKAMNKFHINVPAASQPSKVSVVAGGRILDEETVDPSNVPLQMTVNGIVIPALQADK